MVLNMKAGSVLGSTNISVPSTRLDAGRRVSTRPAPALLETRKPTWWPSVGGPQGLASLDVACSLHSLLSCPAGIWVYDPGLRWHQSRIFEDSVNNVRWLLVGPDFWLGFRCQAQAHQSLCSTFAEMSVKGGSPKEQTQGWAPSLINELVVINYFINSPISHPANIYLTIVEPEDIYWWIKLGSSPQGWAVSS